MMISQADRILPALALAILFALTVHIAACDDGERQQISQELQARAVEATTANAAQEKLRVVTLGGPVTEIAFALGEGDRVVATDKSSLYPPQALSRATLDYYRNISVEGVLAQRPDLVISTAGMGPPATIEQLEEAGIEVVILDDVTTIAEARARIEKMAQLLDAEAAVEELVEAIDAELALAETQVASIERSPRALFLYARGRGTLMVGGEDTPAGMMIEMAGGQNVVEFQGFRPLSAEGVIAAQPDVIVVTQKGIESLGGPEGLWELPGIGESAAGKAGRYIVVDDLKLLGFGPRVGEALAELAKAFASGGEVR